MANSQHGNGTNKNKNSSVNATGMSDASTKPVESMPLDASVSSSKTTTATTLSDSQKTWTNAELSELKSKIGLVAGALADFKAAKGLVAVKEVIFDGNRTFIKIILVAENLNIRKIKTADGIDFDLVAVEK